MKALRTAVVGAGHLGRYHTQKYAELEGSRLVGVVDVVAERARQVAAPHAVPAYADYRELIGKVDAVSVAVPASDHFAIARDFLTDGVHILLEKPIAPLVEEARALIDLARQYDAVLQIGHLERFNPAVLALERRMREPMFIECNRIAPFQPRGTDVSVVLDLMIHDIDLVLSLVDAPIDRIDANGAAVLTDDIDIANARLQFANGCTANVTASRVSAKHECKLRLFQHNTYFSLDLREKSLTVQRKGEREAFPGIPEIVSEQLTHDDSDALLLEIESFLHAARSGTAPVVSGAMGLRALETATEIVRLLR